MGYLEQHSHSNRAGMVIAAGALNGLVIYGLLAAFSGVSFKQMLDPNLRAWDEKEPQMQLEQVPPKGHPPAGKVRDAEPRPTEVATDFSLKFEPGPFLPPDVLPPGGAVIDKPQTPTVPPKRAMALGNPASWAGEADYPVAELRAGHAGTTRFRLAVGTDGRVSDCSVTASSGWPALDEATCRLVSARARFRPATDGAGLAVSGTFSSAIRWVIPG